MPGSIYKSPEGEAEIRTLYDEALARLGPDYESLIVGTRFGDTHVLALGPEDSPPAVFLLGGNALNPTCLQWFLPGANASNLISLIVFFPPAELHHIFAPDIVDHPYLSAKEKPTTKGNGHA